MTKNSSLVPMGYSEISRILPHRYPFLMVDRVVELTPNESIIAYKNVSANEDFVNGHFPGLPIFPGVLQIEALAQTAGILAHASGSIDSKTHIAYLAGVDKARFRRPVVPGDQLELRVKLLSQRHGIIKAEGKALVGNKVCCEATLLAAIQIR